MEYYDRQKYLNLQSVQRRFDRHRVIYMKKIHKELVPNPGIEIEHSEKPRCGLTFNIRNKNNNTREWSSKLRLNSFQVRCLMVFNSLSYDLRNSLSSMDTFKSELGQYLAMIPDTLCYGLGSLIQNDLDIQTKKWEWRLRNGPF